MNLNPDLMMPNAALTLGELVLLGIVSWIVLRVGTAAVKAFGELQVAQGRRFMGEERVGDVQAYYSRMIKVVGGLAALAIVGYNIWLTAFGHNGPDLVVEAFARSGNITGRLVAEKAGGLIGILILVRLLAWLGGQIKQWLVVRLIAAEVVRVPEETIQEIGANFSALVHSLLWLLGAMVTVELFNAPDRVIYWVSFIFSLAVIWGLVHLISDSLDAAVDAIYEGLMVSQRLARWLEHDESRIPRVVGSLKVALRWGVYVGAAAYVIRSAPLDTQAYDITTKLLKAAAILIAAQLALAVAMVIITRLSVGQETDSALVIRRRETMLPLIGSMLRYVLYFVAGVMALQTVGVNVTAILAGAGVAGLAIGFGAQSLVQDVISGFFALFEGVYMVGDYVEMAGIEGTVESITLRTTSIRARDGRLHNVPNGQIKEITNYSKSYVNAVVDVGVSYEGDLEKAISVLKGVGDTALGDIADVTGEARVRVIDFGASDVTLRLIVPVLPGRHWDVSCELRRRVKLSFDAQGVEIPFSRHVVILQTPEGEAVRELPVRLVSDS